MARAAWLGVLGGLGRDVDGPDLDGAADVGSEEEVVVERVERGHDSDEVLVSLIDCLDVAGK